MRPTLPKHTVTDDLVVTHVGDPRGECDYNKTLPDSSFNIPVQQLTFHGRGTVGIISEIGSGSAKNENVTEADTTMDTTLDTTPSPVLNGGNGSFE